MTELNQVAPTLESEENYIALSILDQLGISQPNQNQIDIIETVITLVTKPEKLSISELTKCIGNDRLSKYALSSKSKKSNVNHLRLAKG